MNSKIEREALKPCPFCGNSDVEATSRVVDTNDEKTWGVDCCVTNAHELFLTKQEAIDHWNTRAAPSTETQPEVTGAVGYVVEDYMDALAEYSDVLLVAKPSKLRPVPLYPPSAIEGYAQELAKRLVREKLEEADIKLKIADQMAYVVGDMLDTKSLTPNMLERLRGVFHAYTY